MQDLLVAKVSLKWRRWGVSKILKNFENWDLGFVKNGEMGNFCF